ncbi:MAG: hypothetical protein GF334_10840 [Candidatus Altiarchaeales archaeon]|nr:hypothetical protein [Candidatus Altiarchaeales archaeon]
MSYRKKIVALILVIYLASFSNAFLSGVKKFLCSLADAFEMIGGGLVSLMFLYGGLNYVFNADDPGGRKKARTTCVQAIIGGLIIVIAKNTITMISTGDLSLGQTC